MAAFQFVNLEQLEGKPVSITQDLYYSLNLAKYTNLVERPFIYLAKNSIQTEDDFIQMGQTK